MIKIRLGGLFITLEAGEDIPYAPEYCEHYTYLFHPVEGGYEILRYDAYSGWHKRPDQLFEDGHQAFVFAYHAYQNEWSQTDGRLGGKDQHLERIM